MGERRAQCVGFTTSNISAAALKKQHGLLVVEGDAWRTRIYCVCGSSCNDTVVATVGRRTRSMDSPRSLPR
jgi:hypothetical protein